MTAEEKQKIRKQILAIRNEMPLTVREEKSRAIMKALFLMPIYLD